MIHHNNVTSKVHFALIKRPDEYDAKAYKIYDIMGFIDFFNSPEIKGKS